LHGTYQRRERAQARRSAHLVRTVTSCHSRLRARDALSRARARARACGRYACCSWRRAGCRACGAQEGSTLSAKLSPGLDWHALPPQEALTAVDSDLERGLASDEVALRLDRFGANVLPETARRTRLAVFAGQFKSPLIYLLSFAALIAIALGERTDAIVIAVVVVLNALIGALQEGRAERAVDALRQLVQLRARVLRDGHEAAIAARDLVPGDVLLLEAGDAVPADARLLRVAALQVAEAALTGESAPVAKDVRPLPLDTALGDRTGMAYAGTHVTAGRARAVVVATGRDTEIGKIAALAGAAVQPRTPLERRIDEFGRYVIAGASAVFVAVVALGTLRGIAFGEMLMIGVSALVGMIPEGLPVAMTIALAVGVQRMARRRAIVRRLSAVETLGSTTVICSDKTGTLTRNEMTVTALWLPDGQRIAVSGVGYEPAGELCLEGTDAEARGPALLRLLEAACLCNDAQLEGPLPAEPRWSALGDPTEIALLTLARKAGVEPAVVRLGFPRSAELPFDPAAKLMATGHAAADGPFVVIKGAPEVVVELCARAQHGERVVELDAALRGTVHKAADDLASGALRLLALAVIRQAELDVEAGFAALRGRATLLGLVGEIDPPRAEVGAAIALARGAGIRPVMVTGDHKATGVAIATQLGIARAGDIAVDGGELAKLADDELDACIERIAVFARVHPAQKLRIVEAYQRRGEIVAMTGDGVNDAPALVRADVGVAMGITGTEVAKDAAKIVIADDNFATIVAAVDEGRVVYRNIKKAVLLLFSTSAAEVVVLLGAMLLGYPPPFAAVQILWNNLVTEGLITINLIMEPAEGDEMQRRPIAPAEPLLDRTLLTRMAFMVPTIVAVTLGWFTLRTSAGVPAAQVQTETFTLLAICEWFNVLNCRSDHRSALGSGLLRNPWLLGGLLVGNLLQVAVVFWAPLARVFRTVPFGWEEVVALGVVGSLVLWVEEARKLLVRRRARPS
jgi:magnesium-transporting ATPase (P-type)